MMSFSPASEPVDLTMERMRSGMGTPRLSHHLRRDGRHLGWVATWLHDGAVVDLRDTRTTRLIFELSGGQQVDLLDGLGRQRLQGAAGTVAVVMPSRSPVVRVSGPAATLQVILSDELLEFGRRLPTGRTDRADLRALAAQMLLALTDADDEACHRALLLMAQRLGSHLPNRPAAQRGGLAPHILLRVRAVMMETLATWPEKRPPNRDLADLAGLSVFHFIRAFRQSTGRTPQAWMMDRRIDRAYALLLRGDGGIGEVADATGFASPAHFVSTFRLRNGLTPARLREAARFAHAA